MGKNDIIRNEFAKEMDQFEFLHIFHDKKNASFYDLYVGQKLTRNEITCIKSAYGLCEQAGPNFLCLNTARIYHIANKWVVRFSSKSLSPDPTVKSRYYDCVLVYSEIDPDLENDLKNHTAFDGRMECWEY